VHSENNLKTNKRKGLPRSPCGMRTENAEPQGVAGQRTVNAQQRYAALPVTPLAPVGSLAEQRM